MLEKLYIWVAWHLPKELVSHIYARVVANYTHSHPKQVVSNIKVMDALGYWIYGKDK
jgi:hypothetical protein